LSPDFQIRNICSSDNEKIAGIIRQSLEDFNAVKKGTVYFEESTDRLSDAFTHPNSAYFILEVSGETAGGAGFYPTAGLEQNTCELVKMYLSGKFRGLGLGQTLLTHVMQKAKEKGFEKMYIESMPELTHAISLYKKNGFEFIDHSLGNSGHNGCNVWMLKDPI
jgi:putative acetyltransferase